MIDVSVHERTCWSVPNMLTSNVDVYVKNHLATPCLEGAGTVLTHDASIMMHRLDAD